MLQIQNFSKCYKSGFKAINNISIDVKKVNIFGFIGHNGTRKTKGTALFNAL